MPWYDTAWPYRRCITINSWAIVAAQTNFPTLFKISGIGATTLPSGNDIIFVDSGTNTRMHHDLATYSNYTGNAWVQVPSESAVTNYNFWMYWGNLTGGDQLGVEGYRPSTAWDESYVFVCHMQDGGKDPTVAETKQLKDSTRFQHQMYKRFDGFPGMVKSIVGSSQKWRAATGSWISSNMGSQYDDPTAYIKAFRQFSGQLWLEVFASGTTSPMKHGASQGHMLCTHHITAGDSTSLNGILSLNVRGRANLASPSTNNKGFIISAQLGDTSVWNTSVCDEKGWPNSGSKYHTSLVTLHYKSGGSSGSDQMWRVYSEGRNIAQAMFTSPAYDRKVCNTAKGVYMGQHTIGTGYSYSGTILEARISNRVKNYNWNLQAYLNISSLAAVQDPNYTGTYRYYTINEPEESFGKTITTFNSMSGNALKWSWGPIAINTGYAPRSSSQVGTNWVWNIVRNDPTTYIPSGSQTQWSWCLENA